MHAPQRRAALFSARSKRRRTPLRIGRRRLRILRAATRSLELQPQTLRLALSLVDRDQQQRLRHFARASLGCCRVQLLRHGAAQSTRMLTSNVLTI
eukprot:1091041-Pleurochrysis_carterae.AAC.1